MRHLGKNSPLPTAPDPSLLEAVPRALRSHAFGCDVWHAYEVSAYGEGGISAHGVLKIKYDASTDFIVESKSLKLYLYSLSNALFGTTPENICRGFEFAVREDLGGLLGVNVDAQFFTGITTSHELLDGYEILEACRSFCPNKSRTVKVASHAIATLCPVTGQPDFGTLLLQITGEHLPTRDEVLEIVHNLRGKRAFHEEVADYLYGLFQKRYTPEMLLVGCLYTRRGGIDICPVRYSHVDLEPTLLTSIDMLPPQTFRR